MRCKLCWVTKGQSHLIKVTFVTVVDGRRNGEIPLKSHLKGFEAECGIKCWENNFVIYVRDALRVIGKSP